MLERAFVLVPLLEIAPDVIPGPGPAAWPVAAQRSARCAGAPASAPFAGAGQIDQPIQR